MPVFNPSSNSGVGGTASNPDITYSDAIELLRLNFEGANNGTTFTDSSANNLTVSNTGGVITSTAQFYAGTSSGLFSGSNNLTITDNVFNSPLEMHIRCFLRPTAFNGGYNLYIDTRASGGDGLGFTAGFDSNGKLLVYHSGIVISNVGNISLNTWAQIDIVVLNSILMLFQDTVYVGSSGVLTPSNHTITLGRAVDNSNGYTGYIDGLFIKTRSASVL